MIFVAVGTQKFQLNRLLMEIDRLVSEKKLSESIFAQTGNCDYIPMNYRYKKFMGKEEFEEKIEQCSLLITHAGVGTIMTGLKKRKPVIVFPRMSKYKEHVDNHQLEIAKPFSENGYVLTCMNENTLGHLIEKSRNYNFRSYISRGGTCDSGD